MRRLGIAGRVIALLLLGLAIWNPTWPGARGPVHLLVLLDDSASMATDWLNLAWRDMTQVFADLPNGSELSLIRVADGNSIELHRLATDMALTERIPRSQALARGRSELGQAWRQATALAHGDLPARLLVLSDGRATDTLPELTKQAKKIPALWWSPPDQPPRPRLGEVLLPTSLAVGEASVATVELHGPASPGLRLAMRLDDDPPITIELGAADWQSGRYRLALPRLAAGEHKLILELLAEGRSVQRLERILSVAGPAKVTLITRTGSPPPLATSLAAGGWAPVTLTTEQFSLARLRRTGILVLDDIAIKDLAEAEWRAIIDRVSRDGMGLVVLGGPNSFGSGGYRQSALEDILPVISESPKPQPSAAVLFLVDQSGSMGRPSPGQPSRMSMARQAVLETAARLKPGDLAGLIAFAATPEVRLALTGRTNTASALDQAWPKAASGGTRLLPALRLGLEHLEQQDQRQRLLVLVTDGFVASDESLAALPPSQRHGVQIVALAIGPNADLGRLRQLLGADARILPVADIVRLPALMTTEVDALRDAIDHRPVEPIRKLPIPFMVDPPASWPIVRAHAVTRAKPEARVYLEGPNGEPLLASWPAGLGRVLVLPAGLGDWVPDWWRSPRIGTWLGELIEWGAARQAPRVSLVRQADPATVRFALDVESRDGEWSSDPLQVAMRAPDGTPVAAELAALAPGRWQLTARPDQAGTYRMSISGEKIHHTSAFQFTHLAELGANTPIAAELKSALAAGLVHPWQPGDAIPAGEHARSLRWSLAGLALLSFTLTLMAERRIWRHLRKQ